MDLTNLKDLDDRRDKDVQEKPKTKSEEIAELSGMRLRIYKNGEVYPSVSLVKELGLEYVNKHQEQGFGLDIVDSKKWGPTKNLDERGIFVVPVRKEEAKVELFAGVRFDKTTNEPLSSVLTQGTKSLSFFEMIDEVYGWEDSRYMDFDVVMEPVKPKDGIAYVPKSVARGKEKGTDTYERRENCNFYQLSLFTRVQEVVDKTSAEKTVVLTNK